MKLLIRLVDTILKKKLFYFLVQLQKAVTKSSYKKQLQKAVTNEYFIPI
jgi:hypothetical protein